MKRKSIIFLAAALIFTSLSSTYPGKDVYAVENNINIEVTEADNMSLVHASWKLFKKTVRSEKEDKKLKKNVIMSPLSVYSALTMAENGASGATLTEYEKKAIFTDIDTGTKAISALNSSLVESPLWNVGNSVWVKENYVLKDDYKDTLEKYFNGEFYSEKMDDSTVAKLNNWVSKNTNGMIKNIVSKLDPFTRLLLANAVSFEGKWEREYDDYNMLGIDEAAWFEGVNGKEKAVYVRDRDMDSYLELKGGYGFLNRYKDSDYAFFAFETPDGMSLEKYINTITWKDLYESLSKPKYDADNVTIQFPEFTTDYDVSMVPVMKSLGVKTAFSDVADFSGMLEPKDGLQESLKIYDILHKAHIEVDREGTKAAAATVVLVGATTALPAREFKNIEVILDHPFVYGIVDLETKVPVFIGALTEME